jgi:hypothetical protein
MELVASRVESHAIEQPTQLRRASLDVADEDPPPVRCAPRHDSTL